MLRFLAITCLMAFPAYSIADELATKPVVKQPVLSQLLERIDKLERRIAELETQRAPMRPVAPRAITPPSGPLHQAPTQTIPPNQTPYSTQPPGYQTPLAPVEPPQRNTPQGWQKFNFNGQWFYIVPIDGNRVSTMFQTPK